MQVVEFSGKMKQDDRMEGLVSGEGPNLAPLWCVAALEGRGEGRGANHDNTARLSSIVAASAQAGALQGERQQLASQRVVHRSTARLPAGGLVLHVCKLA